MRKALLRRTGNSLAVTIPRELAERYHLAQGEKAFIVATEHGILITPYDAVTDKAFGAYQRLAKRYQGAMRELVYDPEAKELSYLSHPASLKGNVDGHDTLGEVMQDPAKFYDDE